MLEMTWPMRWPDVGSGFLVLFRWQGDEPMTKVVVKNKPKRRSGAKGKTAVVTKRVKNHEGRAQTLHTLDFGSATFGADFQYVFSRNVAKARRENKRIIGTADVAVPKR
jgi:hypothetical protein